MPTDGIESSADSASRRLRDRLSKMEQRQILAAEARIEKTLSRCPNCKLIYAQGDLVCTHCGMPFVTRTTLKKATGAEPGLTSHDETLTRELKPITLYCGSKHWNVAFTRSMTLGRTSAVPGDPQPDVDLTEFGAADKGVSRQHARILRKRDLMYVEDLGSSNGTFLNGLPLMRNSLRVLRSGDEVQLGTLKLRVAF